MALAVRGASVLIFEALMSMHTMRASAGSRLRCKDMAHVPAPSSTETFPEPFSPLEAKLSEIFVYLVSCSDLPQLSQVGSLS